MDQVESLLVSKRVKYIPSGKRFMINCLNPDHEDRNPSLGIDKLTGNGKCFSCGFTVNIFSHFNIQANFQSIKVQQLKEKIGSINLNLNGLEIPDNAMNFTTKFRGISVATLREYEAFTVLSDEWENRIIFPLRDSTGLIRSFIGRHMFSDEGARYLVRPHKADVPFFPPNVKPHLGQVVFVEGIFDALNLLDKGFDDSVVCIFGATTLFTMKGNGITVNAKAKPKLEELKLRGVVKINLAFDGDDAGLDAREKSRIVLEEMGFIVEDIDLPEGEDPGSLSKEDVLAMKECIWEQESP